MGPCWYINDLVAIVLDSQFRGLGLKPPSSSVTDSTLFVYKADKMISKIPGNLVIKRWLKVTCLLVVALWSWGWWTISVKRCFSWTLKKYFWLCGITLEELLKPAFNIFAFFWIVEVEAKGFSETV